MHATTQKTATARRSVPKGKPSTPIPATGAALPTRMVQNPLQYTPELRDLLRALALLSKRDGRWLIRAIYQALLGDPLTAQEMVSLWFRTLHRSRMVTRNGADAAVLGPSELLHFLASAPALPSIRQHHIGGRERYAVYFFPFGTQGMAQYLGVPLAFVDVRINRALHLLQANPWAFRDLQMDKTYGCFTYSGFAYTQEAQDKLDDCRPVFVASAVRAVAAAARIEEARSDRARALQKFRQTAGADRVFGASRMISDRMVLAEVPTYVRAMVENNSLAAVRQAIAAKTTASERAQDPEVKAAHDLFIDAFRFVLDERRAPSLPLRSATPVRGVSPRPTVDYAVLPNDSQILQFGREVAQQWRATLIQARVQKREQRSRAKGKDKV